MTAFVRTALAAAVLIVPVVAQLVVPGLEDETAGHLVFAGSQLLGWILLGTVVRDAAVRNTRPARLGRMSVLAGCGLQALFAVSYGLTAFDGEPMEAAFVMF